MYVTARHLETVHTSGQLAVLDPGTLPQCRASPRLGADPTDIVINTQGTRLILNLRDVALQRRIGPFDAALELMAMQSPALEPSLQTGMMGSAPRTATSTIDISISSRAGQPNRRNHTGMGFS